MLRTPYPTRSILMFCYCIWGRMGICLTRRGHATPLRDGHSLKAPTGSIGLSKAKTYNALCDGVPELIKTQQRGNCNRHPTPQGTLHEAFFDPVTIGTGVGADSSNGVIKPAGFTVDGTSTSITGLKYDDGSVSC